MKTRPHQGAANQDDDAFPAYLEAFLERRPAAHHFSVLTNAVFVSDRLHDAELLLDVLHEWAHSQLCDTPLGLTLQIVGKLAANIQRTFIPIISDGLLEVRASQDLDPSTHRDLFVFGRCTNIVDIPTAFEPRWRATLRNPQSRLAIENFQTAYARWSQLLARWSEVQEVFAIACSHGLATGTLPDDTGIIATLCELLDVPKDATTSALPDVADRQLVTLLKSRGRYRRAADLYMTTASSYGPYSTLVLSLAASLFPYNTCDLLDMPAGTFSGWLSDGPLDPSARMMRLQGHAGLAARFRDDLGVAEDLLAIASGDDLQQPSLDDESHLFGAWTRRYLWGSTLFETAVGDRVERFLSGDILAQNKIFDIDRTKDIRMSVNLPNWVFERDRRIVCPPEAEEAFRQNFTDAYAARRTADLLRLLEERFGHDCR